MQEREREDVAPPVEPSSSSPRPRRAWPDLPTSRATLPTERASNRRWGYRSARCCNVPGRVGGYERDAAARRADRGGPRRAGCARLLPLGRARALRSRRAGRSVGGRAGGRRRPLRHRGAPRLARTTCSGWGSTRSSSRCPMPSTPTSPARASRPACTCCARSRWRCRSRSAIASRPRATRRGASCRSAR